jgi:hypothetical protein
MEKRKGRPTFPCISPAVSRKQKRENRTLNEYNVALGFYLQESGVEPAVGGEFHDHLRLSSLADKPCHFRTAIFEQNLFKQSVWQREVYYFILRRVHAQASDKPFEFEPVR